MSSLFCANCGREFVPDARNRHHQKYCFRKACRRVRDARRRARFRENYAAAAEYRRSEVVRVTASRRRAKQRALKSDPVLLADFTRAAFLGLVSQLTGTDNAHQYLYRCMEYGLELTGKSTSHGSLLLPFFDVTSRSD